MEMVIACAGYEEGRRVADLELDDCATFADRPGRFVWLVCSSRRWRFCAA